MCYSVLLLDLGDTHRYPLISSLSSNDHLVITVTGLMMISIIN